MKISFFAVLICIAFSCSKPLPNPIEEPIKPLNEIQVINDVIDSLYFFEYCFGPFPPPPPPLSDSIRYQQDYQEFLKERIEFNNYLDSTPPVMMVVDTLRSLDVSEFLASEDIHDSIENEFRQGKNITINLNQRFFDLDSLSQTGVIFEKKDIKPNKYGRIDGRLYGGSLSFSRILFSEDKSLGIFFYEYYGGTNCAFGRYALLRQEKTKWVVQKLITVWIA